MSEENTTWYVVENAPEKRIPQMAKLFCTVLIHTYDDFALFNRLLTENSMIAYKDTYSKFFKRFPPMTREPISVQDFLRLLNWQKEENMYRIIWCTTRNALGETRSRDEQRMENVILWIMVNHQTLSRLSAGYTVYAVDQDGSNQESIWNWQPDPAMCFGKLYKPGFQRMVRMVNSELHVYTDAQEFIRQPEIDLELDEFASIVGDVG